MVYVSSMLEEKKMKECDGSTKECDRSYRCRLCQNNTRDMMDHISAVYARRQNKKTRRIVYVLFMLEDKKKKKSDGSYRCRLRKNKTRDITDRISAIYARRQNERT